MQIINGDLNVIKIAVPLKYLSNFWRSSEMSLISCNIELSLTWIKDCALATSVSIANDAIVNAAKATFKIKDAKLYVSVLTLSKEDNIELRKQLSKGFKRSVYRNKYKVTPNKNEVGTNEKIVCSCF